MIKFSNFFFKVLIRFSIILIILSVYSCLDILQDYEKGKNVTNPPFYGLYQENNLPDITNPPKNIIILISDGGGYNHIKATNLYLGIDEQEYEKWSESTNGVKMSISTYNWFGEYDVTRAWTEYEYIEDNYTDSAAAATAMATGIKTDNGIIGMNVTKVYDLENVLEIAEKKGKSTGVVTSVPFSHATPAAFIIHNISRSNYAEIARDMLDSPIDVIMGCGHPYYNSNGQRTDQNEYDLVGGEQYWNNLSLGLLANDADNDGDDEIWNFIESKEQFENLANNLLEFNRVAGIVQNRYTLQAERYGNNQTEVNPGDNSKGDEYISSSPSLGLMTKGALNVLAKNSNGFLLMIEGGAIDWKCHGNRFNRMIEEQIDFNNAVTEVIDWIHEESDWEETLVIVTADHETGYLIGPEFSNDNMQFSDYAVVSQGSGNLPLYKWGNSDSDTSLKPYSPHTNSLVPFFAKGACANLFSSMVIDSDPNFGDYIDNTAIGLIIKKILNSF